MNHTTYFQIRVLELWTWLALVPATEPDITTVKLVLFAYCMYTTPQLTAGIDRGPNAWG